MRDDDRLPPLASLDVPVPQDKAATWRDEFGSLGAVGSHHTSSENKTDEVIDVEARLQNMTGFRDRLRVLMGWSVRAWRMRRRRGAP